jgi:hypothetical protein
MKNENVTAFNQRIKKAETFDDFANLGKSLDRLYAAQVFTPKEFARLDVKLMESASQKLSTP